MTENGPTTPTKGTSSPFDIRGNSDEPKKTTKSMQDVNEIRRNWAKLQAEKAAKASQEEASQARQVEQTQAEVRKEVRKVPSQPSPAPNPQAKPATTPRPPSGRQTRGPRPRTGRLRPPPHDDTRPPAKGRPTRRQSPNHRRTGRKPNPTRPIQAEAPERPTNRPPQIRRRPSQASLPSDRLPLRRRLTEDEARERTAQATPSPEELAEKLADQKRKIAEEIREGVEGIRSFTSLSEAHATRGINSLSYISETVRVGESIRKGEELLIVYGNALELIDGVVNNVDQPDKSDFWLSYPEKAKDMLVVKSG